MKLSHLTPLLLLAACSLTGGDSTSDLDTSRLRDGDNGDSAECRECAAAVEDCLVDGGECAELYFECERICLDPRDPDGSDECARACEDRHEECDDTEADGDCGGLEECLAGCESTDPDEPPPGDDCDHCEAGNAECLAGGNSEQECAADTEECLRQCRGDEPTDPSCEACDLDVEQCLAGAGDDEAAREECWAHHAECCASSC